MSKAAMQKQRRLKITADNKRKADAEANTAKIVKQVNITQKAQGAPPMSQSETNKLHEQLLNGAEYLRFDVEPPPNQSAPAAIQCPADVNRASDARSYVGNCSIVDLGLGSEGWTDDVIQTIARRWSEQRGHCASHNPQWVEGGHGNGHIDIAMSPSLPTFIAEASGVTGKGGGRIIIAKSNCE